MSRSLPVSRLLLLAVFLTPGIYASGETPAQETWKSFISVSSGEGRIPEDREMGLLANLNRPDSRWGDALSLCNMVFDNLSEGRVPEEYILPEMKIPQEWAFVKALESGRLDADRRFGRPVRTGSRLDLPVRLSSAESVGYGHVYLYRRDGTWYIEQWGLDLSPFIVDIDLPSDGEEPADAGTGLIGPDSEGS